VVILVLYICSNKKLAEPIVIFLRRRRA